jgi:L-ascorbate metabolism protein UlaG (beta-lactamase superfamily)
MKKLFWAVIILVILIGAFYALNGYIYNEKQGENVNQNTENTTTTEQEDEISVTPISHATMVLKWGDKTIITDPVGGATAFSGQPDPNIVLITDIHGDHLNLETLQAVAKNNTTVIIPKAVADQSTNLLPGLPKVLNNGESMTEHGFTITAVPMYNVPESDTAYHIKGRGNGYIIEAGGKRVYIAGDTGNTPEVRALQNIDWAFVPMNLPFTMSVEEAASAVLAFKPKRVTPYHYRGQQGLSDTNKFRELVNAGNEDITVDLINFYPSN